MAQLPSTFDPNSVAPLEPMESELVPPAWYGCKIEASDVKQTSAKTGYFAEFRLRIADGPKKGVVLFARINVVNDSAKAQELGQRELAALCQSVGYTQPVTDTAQLHDSYVDALVRIEPGSGQYGPKNVVKGWAPAGTKSGTESNLAAQTLEVPQAAPRAAASAAAAPTMAAAMAAPAAQAAPQAQPTAAPATPAKTPAPTATATVPPWARPK